MNDSKMFREMLSAYIYNKGCRLDAELNNAISALSNSKHPNSEYINQVYEAFFRKLEFERTSKEVMSIVSLYMQ